MCRDPSAQVKSSRPTWRSRFNLKFWRGASKQLSPRVRVEGGPRGSSRVMFDDLDDDEPEAWPRVEQRRLDESLRCAICGDLFGMPVSFATCTHTCE
jgi:hypothetical protein